MIDLNKWEIEKFLKDFPYMSLRPCLNEGLLIKGRFVFKASLKNGEKPISDDFDLSIDVPPNFPRALPKVKEIGGKIPKDGNHHVNSDDTLCLGSPIRLLSKIASRPTISGYVEKCLIPYLYAVSCNLQTGVPFLFGELAHGDKGIMDDYLNLFGLKEESQVIQTLTLLGMNPRVANKRLCPCGCGRRLAHCTFREKLNKFRPLAPRLFFREQASRLRKP